MFLVHRWCFVTSCLRADCSLHVLTAVCCLLARPRGCWEIWASTEGTGGTDERPAASWTGGERDRRCDTVTSTPAPSPLALSRRLWLKRQRHRLWLKQIALLLLLHPPPSAPPLLSASQGPAPGWLFICYGLFSFKREELVAADAESVGVKGSAVHLPAQDLWTRDTAAVRRGGQNTARCCFVHVEWNLQ